MRRGPGLLTVLLVMAVWSSLNGSAAGQIRVTPTARSLEFAPDPGPGGGRHIVLVSGDEEYRSEEALPLLAAILSGQHGFRCTVLFAIDPQTGIIQPNCSTNIPGLQALTSADLLILFTRFRNLPGEQMQHIDAYLRRGGPVLGMRTSTHAFQLDASSRYVHYSNAYSGPSPAWQGGFGKLVLGAPWVAHHGKHGQQGTRGIRAPAAEKLPLARGLHDGDVWGATDVYAVNLPLPPDCQPVLLGQLTHRQGEFDERDIYFGMRPNDPPEPDAQEEDLMPIAWIKSYQIPAGVQGRAMMSTIGASVDLLQEGTRRLLVNGVYWCSGLENEIPPQGTQVDIPGSYHPTQFQFRPDVYWQELSLTPQRIIELMALPAPDDFPEPAP